jgi:hypothetical protein
MEVCVGDTYIFLAECTRRVSHFSNFEIGKKYVVDSIRVISGFDEYIDSGKIVSFSNFDYAVYVYELEEYFVRIEDFRESRLNSIGV